MTAQEIEQYEELAKFSEYAGLNYSQATREATKLIKAACLVHSPDLNKRLAALQEIMRQEFAKAETMGPEILGDLK